MMNGLIDIYSAYDSNNRNTIMYRIPQTAHLDDGSYFNASLTPFFKRLNIKDPNVLEIYNLGETETHYFIFSESHDLHTLEDERSLLERGGVALISEQKLVC